MLGWVTKKVRLRFFPPKRFLFLKSSFLIFLTKCFYKKLIKCYGEPTKKKLTVLLENGARFKCRFGLAPSAAVTSFIEIEL